MRGSTFSPFAFTAAMIALPVEVPYSVFSLTTATFSTLKPAALRSDRNATYAAPKSVPMGVGRKNHLNPRSVRLGAEDSGARNGMPYRSATALAVSVQLDW